MTLCKNCGKEIIKEQWFEGQHWVHKHNYSDECRFKAEPAELEVEKGVETVIIDDNPLSIACYLEEHPEIEEKLLSAKPEGVERVIKLNGTFCKGKNRKGKPCELVTTNLSGYCGWHNHNEYSEIKEIAEATNEDMIWAINEVMKEAEK